LIIPDKKDLLAAVLETMGRKGTGFGHEFNPVGKENERGTGSGGGG
jgi:hypothetical protein